MRCSKCAIALEQTASRAASARVARRDGHPWQVMWMNPAAAQQGPEGVTASTQDAGAPA